MPGIVDENIVNELYFNQVKRAFPNVDQEEFRESVEKQSKMSTDERKKFFAKLIQSVHPDTAEQGDEDTDKMNEAIFMRDIWKNYGDKILKGGKKRPTKRRPTKRRPTKRKRHTKKIKHTKRRRWVNSLILFKY